MRSLLAPIAQGKHTFGARTLYRNEVK